VSKTCGSLKLRWHHFTKMVNRFSDILEDFLLSYHRAHSQSSLVVNPAFSFVIMNVVEGIKAE
jgi:hypothetical protein